MRLLKNIFIGVVGVLFLITVGCVNTEKNAVKIEDTRSLDIELTNQIDTQIASAMAKLKVVSGISIAVYSEQGTYTNAFGVVDVETQEPATADSAFYVASSTKSMVAVVMAILHERGVINLDSTLSEFAPDANFPAEVQPTKVTLRHLLAQSSGLINLPIQNRLAFTGQYSSEILWGLLAQTKVNTKEPMGTFNYTNYNYNILTMLVEHKLNKSWKEILTDEIFDKVGMDRTSAYISKAENEQWSLARPHTTLDKNSPKRTYLEKTDVTMQSAGGVIMSAKDAAKWLEIIIQQGKYQNTQVIPKAAIQATLKPNVTVNRKFADYTRDYYGLGWYIGTYKEKPFIHHFGGFSGTRAHVSFMPNSKVGVVVFVNGDGVGFKFADIVANYLYGLFEDPNQAKYKFEQDVADLANWRDKMQAKVIARKEQLSQRQWKLNLPFEKYLGTYTNSLYGSFEVSLKQQALLFEAGNLHAIATPYIIPNSVRVELVPGSGEAIVFSLNSNNNVSNLTYQGSIFNKD
ncbi:MAG: serine hydrolase [Paraglaciecola sp.]|uniref:serine hydrolase n=1 Tax=Paraglaciecola sp. TaxID=1920173 RepID=UPI0032975422